MCLRTLTLVAASCLTGCSVADLATADRYANGLVVVLPGIEGRSVYNVNIARGLAEGGVGSAIEIFDWGTGTPGGFLVNLTALERNKRQAEKLARRILRYQEAFPHRPVHLIGHSGGAGIAVLALSALPEGRKVTAAYLLGAALSPEDDLTSALRHVELGIWNFYSAKDLGFLGVGTSLFGTMDRTHTRAAGSVGFRVPDHLDQAGRALYADKLHQAAHNRSMAREGSDGTHFGWARQRFARNRLARMVLKDVDAVRASCYWAPSLAAGRAGPSTNLSGK